jgi:hypothetical protein
LRSVYSEFGNRVVTATTDAGGTAVLVVGQDGKLFGSITEMGERHQISTSADGRWQIIKEGYSGYEKRVDDGGVIPRPEVPTRGIQLELDKPEVSSSPYRMMKAERSSNVIYPAYKTGTAKIAVLMYYDESMSNAFSTADFISQLANNAYADSGARIEIDIVGMKAVNIDDQASHRHLYDAMDEAAAPFADIADDRSFFSADLVILLRATEAPGGEDPCGLGSYGVYAGKHNRNRYVGVVQWQPNTGQGSYCPELTFAHEVGHMLGGAHNREDKNEEGDETLGAYSYSYGTTVLGSHTTVMGVDREGPTPRLGFFSSPNLSCNGYPCGKSASSADSANNVSTFHGTGHLIASNEGEFAFEAVSASPYGTKSLIDCTTSNEEAGYSTGMILVNQSGFDVDLESLHLSRPDGTGSTYSYDPGERIAVPGSYTGGAVCLPVDAEPWFGGFYNGGFIRYRHPETGEIVETAFVMADAGDYRSVRIAAGSGGLVSGNPQQSVLVGSSKTLTFTPDTGYSVASIQSNCSGRKSGNNYTVDVGLDDCFVEASFNHFEAFEPISTDPCNAYGTSGAYVQKIFIAYLGRPPAPAGLKYWAEFLDTDQEQGKLVLFDNLYYSAEAEALYENATVEDRVEQFFQFMYGRGPQAIGKNYWVDAINDGEVTVPESAAVIADSGGGPDLAVLNAKQVAATKLTCAIGDDELQLNAYQQNISAARASIAAIATAEQAETYDGVAELSRIIEAGP